MAKRRLNGDELRSVMIEAMVEITRKLDTRTDAGLDAIQTQRIHVLAGEAIDEIVEVVGVSSDVAPIAYLDDVSVGEHQKLVFVVDDTPGDDAEATWHGGGGVRPTGQWVFPIPTQQRSLDSTEAEHQSPEHALGPMTDDDWAAARKALGKGSRSIFFGTSDKAIDDAAERLSETK